MTRRGLTLGAAVALLDISLAFQNVWPTPLVRWGGELSVECGVFLMLLIAAPLSFGPLSRAAIRGLTAAWMFLVVSHYADVTTPALYGRDVNLYWDVRYMPDVAAMITRAAPAWSASRDARRSRPPPWPPASPSPCSPAWTAGWRAASGSPAASAHASTWRSTRC